MTNLGIDINSEQYTTIFKELKQLKQPNTKKGQAKQHGITNMINKFEKQINTKIWNITVKIKYKVIWDLSETYSRPRYIL